MRGCRRLTIASLVAALAIGACTSPFLPEEPDATPLAVFDAFWSDFDAYYAFFGDKSVDWDAVRSVQRARVDDSTDERELFTVLQDMVSGFEDGHITIVTPFASWAYDGWRTNHPANYDAALVARHSSGTLRAMGAGMRAGRLRPDIGYIHISTFAGHGFGDAFNRALLELGDVAALVLDVRSNGGGSDVNSDAVLQRLADRSRVYGFASYRNGPRHTDFTAPRPKHVAPGGGTRFAGPIAVVTNRGTFSAAEDFVLATRVLPDVIVVGDTTGGGSGNPYWRELPNGWSFRLSRWRVVGADGLFYEGTGIPPHVPARLEDNDRLNGIDSMLRTAEEQLRQRIAGS